MKRLLGMLVCRWKGKHVERRVAINEEWIPGAPGVPSPNRICTRCGHARIAKQRKKAAA